MKNGLLFLSIILILGCNSLTKSKIDANFLIGGEWCGESELAGGQICLEFMESKAYLTVKREKFYNPLDYTIMAIKGKSGFFLCWSSTDLYKGREPVG